MKAPYYPVFLDIDGRLALVVGGGDVALGKVEGLLEAGATVRVVSPALTPSLTELAEGHTIEWIARAYRPGDLAGAWLAVAATDDSPTNMAVAEEAAQQRILVNVVDKPAACSFTAPAVMRRDGLTIAISTNGRSPAMARKVREELETLLPPEYGPLLEIAAEVRGTLQREGLRAPPELWRTALSKEVLDLVREGRRTEAAKTLDEALRPGLVSAQKGRSKSRKR